MTTSRTFKGRHFPKPVILLCIRWYLAYSLSYRDLQEMMAERGIQLDASTILRKGPREFCRGPIRGVCLIGFPQPFPGFHGFGGR
jgi:hypothetical protein